jgi:integrase/recombinase XerD
MTPLRQQMTAALQRRGKSDRTQQSAIRAVRRLAQFYGQSPALSSEQPLPHDVLHRKHVEGLSPSSRRICYSALRFFSHQGRERPWKPLERLRAQTAPRLPAVLSLPAGHRLLTAMTLWHHHVYCPTLSRCGLRLHEALSLPVGDIDGSRHRSHVHRGQGAKDRDLPLPEDPLDLFAPTGNPTATPPGSFPPLAVLTPTWPAPPPLGPAAASRALFAQPTNALVSANATSAPQTLRNVSPHYSSFVDSPDLLPPPFFDQTVEIIRW